jgi:hypothetical protein
MKFWKTAKKHQKPKKNQKDNCPNRSVEIPQWQ